MGRQNYTPQRAVSLDANGTAIRQVRSWLGPTLFFNDTAVTVAILVYDDASATGVAPTAGNLRWTIPLLARTSFQVDGDWRFDNGVKVASATTDANVGVCIQTEARNRTE